MRKHKTKSFAQNLIYIVLLFLLIKKQRGPVGDLDCLRAPVEVVQPQACATTVLSSLPLRETDRKQITCPYLHL
ncbi:hypothetical protein CEXT_43041 [Caerostris extrusa]|uniref:Secreted protein n=1 Tax=Caerostris extrusa TaxID=172846 RepID=A0AAV4WK11_CAEEX|nr:hypothetical protein CEXT_43041 [Caerostris extrusa]